MRILYFGSTEGSSLSLPYYNAMLRLGHEAVAFEPGYTKGLTDLERLIARLTKLPPRRHSEKVAAHLIHLCHANRFDAVFVMAENFLTHDTIKEIKATVRPAPLFIYHSHDNNFSDGILKPSSFVENLCAYDLVFTTKSQNVARYRELGQLNSVFIPSAYDPTVHRPVAKQYSALPHPGFEISFLGTYDRSRDKYVQAVGWEHLSVWGSHWKRSPDYAANVNRIHANPVYYFEFADIISHSKINLGLLRDEAQDLHTTRTFEIPACGGFQMAPRNEEMQSFFEEDKEIVLFESLDELKAKSQYYLAHESECLKIARNGFDRLKRDRHTYLDRMETILAMATGARELPRAATA